MVLQLTFQDYVSMEVSSRDQAPTAPEVDVASDGVISRSPSGRVELLMSGAARVDGNLKFLTPAQYHVVQALLEAGEQGLNKEELVTKSGHGDARGVLGRLREDGQWAEVIKMARVAGRRYRIV